MPQYGDYVECDVKDIPDIMGLLSEQATLSTKILMENGTLEPSQRIRIGWMVDTGLTEPFFQYLKKERPPRATP